MVVRTANLFEIDRNAGCIQQPLPHPGIYHGPYPCRNEDDPGFLEAALKFVVSRFVNPEAASKQKQKAFVSAVHAASDHLEHLDDSELSAHIQSIGRMLRLNRMDDDSAARAFATIREVAGRTLNMRHYDCQLVGGWVMLNGHVAEMQTGEGKTLTATLPAACAALAGIPVHVVTANDYLVARDAGLMRSVYERLGLSVGYVQEGMDVEERKQAYRCNITYCTSKQLAFDYLRDRLILKRFDSPLDFIMEPLYTPRPSCQNLLLQGLNFAIVDEADSVFIDEARTPLILSSRTGNTQREAIHREAVWLAREFKEARHYTIERNARRVNLTKAGMDYLETLTSDMQGIWKGPRKSVILIEQALAALHLYRRDIDYIVYEGAVQIIDENTGRVMPDRSWESGLHQMIEEKEGCEQTGQTETLARISYQRFFRRYHRLAGMTGTAREVRTELLNVYGLNVVAIPTNKPVQRTMRPDYVYKDHESKWQAVINSIRAEHAAGRPVLVGTRTVKDSETVSSMLSDAGLRHRMLNAKQDREEADIVAHAGESGQITVATNMAGRGTDIKLDDTARKAGGLHVISCEKNLSARIDRQLAGRCGRQGDPGSYEAILSLQDTLLENLLGVLKRMVSALMRGAGLPDPQWPGRALMRYAQKRAQVRDRRLRLAMMKADKKRESLLAFGGSGE